MTVGVVGIGLIGGSFAKAYKAAGHRVLVEDIGEQFIVGYITMVGIEAALVALILPNGLHLFLLFRSQFSVFDAFFEALGGPGNPKRRYQVVVFNSLLQ